MLLVESSDPEELVRISHLGCCAGVFVTPFTLMRDLTQGESVGERIDKVLMSHPGRISVPTLNGTAPFNDSLCEEAERIQGQSGRIVVAIPFSVPGLKAISHIHARLPSPRASVLFTNATGIMTFAQACLASAAGARYVSIHWNRIRDIDSDPHFVIRRTREVFDKQRNGSQIIACDLRSPYDATEALKAGAHLVAVSPQILREMIEHPQAEKYTDQYSLAALEVAIREGRGDEVIGPG